MTATASLSSNSPASTSGSSRKSFSWLDHTGVRVCHPLIDLHEATDSLIHHLETRQLLM
ncbi:MAG: hypothetical protein QOE54_92 [Streptosporangiaceae bacterium]|jgi:hypothetical protein|nr:hypothetical protein [Streptosporangiaceae bacterium]